MKIGAIAKIRTTKKKSEYVLFRNVSINGFNAFELLFSFYTQKSGRSDHKNGDENKEINVDKFWGNDNEVDNLNGCLAVLNRLWGYMHKDFGENNITSSENPSFDKLTGYGKNYLDGWLLTFDVEMPNTTINLCT